MDKRDAPRIQKHIPLEIAVITYPPDTVPPVIGSVLDIGQGGIRFLAGRAYESGALLKLSIHLTGWQQHKRSVALIVDDALAVAPLSAVVEVKWSEAGDRPGTWTTGARFEDIYEDDYQALQKHLDAILERNGTIAGSTKGEGL